MVRPGYHKITGHQTEHNKISQSSLGDSAEVMDLDAAMRDVHSSHDMSANKGDFHGTSNPRFRSRGGILTPVLVGLVALLLFYIASGSDNMTMPTAADCGSIIVSERTAAAHEKMVREKSEAKSRKLEAQLAQAASEMETSRTKHRGAVASLEAQLQEERKSLALLADQQRDAAAQLRTQSASILQLKHNCTEQLNAKDKAMQNEMAAYEENINCITKQVQHVALEPCVDWINSALAALQSRQCSIHSPKLSAQSRPGPSSKDLAAIYLSAVNVLQSWLAIPLIQLVAKALYGLGVVAMLWIVIALRESDNLLTTKPCY